MYIIMNSYLHILCNDCHNKSSTHIVNDLCVMRTFKICLLSNVQACNPGLLTIVTSLYIIFLGLNCLTELLYLLKISIHCADFSTPPLATTNLFSVL